MYIFLQELAHGLSELLSYEGNVEEDFFSTFQVLFRANNFLLTIISYVKMPFVIQHLSLEQMNKD